MQRTGNSRRDFLKSALAGSAALYFPQAVLGRDGTISPNEQIVLGGIGINHRGTYVLNSFLPEKEVRFAAIADVRKDRRLAVKALAEETQGTHDVAMYRDFRELLDRQDIDAVLIATGDRWHAHASIYAARAGKDVYSEKPCAISIDLCNRLAETMRQYGTVFQGGTQRRSVWNFQYACALAQSGKLGKIHTVHASIYYLNLRTTWLPAQPVPEQEELDWNLWLGPAPWRPYNHQYCMGAWRGYDDFDSGARHLDWGAHTVDLCQWALGMDGTMPVRYWAEGDRMYATYENGVKLVMRPNGWLGLGTCPIRLEGTDGWVETGDTGRMVVSSAPLYSTEKTIAGTDAKTHVRNFLDCIPTRRQPVCNADVIRSSHIACHASALSWILGRELKLDPRTVTFLDDEEANRMRFRASREPWMV